jgi:hypothetical protein
VSALREVLRAFVILVIFIATVAGMVMLLDTIWPPATVKARIDLQRIPCGSD